MRTTTAEALGESHYDLAEGIVWDAEGDRILWVDIEAGQVLTAPASALHLASTVAQLPTSVGCVVPGDGGLVLATGNTITWRGANGDHVETPALFAPDGIRRFNDGLCDPEGRLLIGTLSRGVDQPDEQLIRVEHDGSATVLRSGVRLSNGLTFHPGGSLFHVDSFARTVSWCDYRNDPTTWHLAFETEGVPDGMCADDDGYLWIAHWGLGEVIRYTIDGTPVERVVVPAEFVTSCAFVGQNLDRLVITTARTEDARSDADGRLYEVDLSGRVQGRPNYRFRAWSPTL